ncbi:MAG: DUF3467 domain-containing protein [Patescibacteria group bacterium]|jgi:hypothetical protein
MPEQPQQPVPGQQIQINAKPEILSGAYSNVMRVLHKPEEFTLEFINVQPPVGELVARIITTPGHVKRIAKVLQENLEKYEAQFGKIPDYEGPTTNSEIGFKS